MKRVGKGRCPGGKERWERQQNGKKSGLAEGTPPMTNSQWWALLRMRMSICHINF